MVEVVETALRGKGLFFFSLEMRCVVPDAGWHAVDGVDPRVATFPAAARFNDVPVWIFRSDAGFFGVAYSCPHAHQTMNTGQIVENGTVIRCSYHHYTFRLSDGHCVSAPGYTLAVYEVKEDAGRLSIRRRGSAPP